MQLSASPMEQYDIFMSHFSFPLHSTPLVQVSQSAYSCPYIWCCRGACSFAESARAGISTSRLKSRIKQWACAEIYFFEKANPRAGRGCRRHLLPRLVEKAGQRKSLPRVGLEKKTDHIKRLIPGLLDHIH